MRRRALLALALVVLAGPIGTARGDDEDAEKRAKTLYQRGEKFFSLGRFDDALGAYKAAYEAFPLPGFHFNIAQCYRNLGDPQSAIESYQRYLDEEQNVPNRKAVQNIIVKLEKEVEDRRKQRDGADLTGGNANNNTGGNANSNTGNAGGRGNEGGAGNGRVVDTGGKPFYKRWQFWAGVAAVSAAGAGTTYYLWTRDNAPSTDLGNLDFGK